MPPLLDKLPSIGQLTIFIYDKRDDFYFLSQTFRSWVLIFLLRRLMTFSHHNLYDMPRLTPRLNVLFWGSGDFTVSSSHRDRSWNPWNRHSGSFMVDTGDLMKQCEVSLSHMLMAFWSSTSYSDFPTSPIWTFSRFKIVTVMWYMTWVFHWTQYTKVKASLKYRETIALTKLTTIKVLGLIQRIERYCTLWKYFILLEAT